MNRTREDLRNALAELVAFLDDCDGMAKDNEWFCMHCNPKGSDWQEAHTPDCTYVAMMERARGVLEAADAH